MPESNQTWMQTNLLIPSKTTKATKETTTTTTTTTTTNKKAKTPSDNDEKFREPKFVKVPSCSAMSDNFLPEKLDTNQKNNIVEADYTDGGRGARCGGRMGPFGQALSIVTEIVNAFCHEVVVSDAESNATVVASEAVDGGAATANDKSEKTMLPHSASSTCCGNEVNASVIVQRRKWNWRLIIPAVAFFCAFAGDAGERMLLTLFAANLPFCWDADKLGDVITARLLGAFAVSALALYALRKARVDDYVIAVISIGLAAISHVAFAFTKEVWRS